MRAEKFLFCSKLNRTLLTALKKNSLNFPFLKLVLLFDSTKQLQTQLNNTCNNQPLDQLLCIKSVINRKTEMIVDQQKVVSEKVEQVQR